MKKLLSVALLAVLVLYSSGLISGIHASVSFHGVITSDTTWTKNNSPYRLDGPTAVNQGVTLTMEPGVTIFLNTYYIQVNGTLLASGTDSDKITFIGGTVSLTSISSSNSVIQNAEFTGGLSVSTSAKITRSTIHGIDIGGGSPTISYNAVGAMTISRDSSPKISNNDITGAFSINGAPTIMANNIQSRPWVHSGTPTISNNKLNDGIHADASGSKVTISNNEINSKGNYPIILVAGTQADITDNKIIGNSDKPIGITVGGYLSSAKISGNQIYNCQTGISVMQSNVQISKNVIFNCDLGVNIALTAPIAGASAPYNTTPLVNVQTNSISKNIIGLQYSPYLLTSTISNNNIFDNTQYDFKLVQFSSDLTIANNWWGTTDTSAISQKIYDNNFDFNLGKVNFNPILTAPNSQAPVVPADISTPTPTSAPITTISPSQSPGESTYVPTQHPTATFSQPGTGSQFNLTFVEVAILVVLIVIAVLLGVLIFTLRNRR